MGGLWRHQHSSGLGHCLLSRVRVTQCSLLIRDLVFLTLNQTVCRRTPRIPAVFEREVDWSVPCCVTAVISAVQRQGHNAIL